MHDHHSAALLAKLREEGTAGAWPEFLEAFAPLILGAARSAVGDADAAGDAFVFVCERLAEDRFARLRRFNPQGGASFPTWLRVVSVNLARDWRRQRFGRPRIFRALQDLSPLHQAFFRARYRHGLTSQEAHGVLAKDPAGAGAPELQAVEEEIEQRLTARHRLALAIRPALARPGSVEELAERGEELADGADDRPDEVFFRRRRAAEMRRALASLSPEDRLLVRLRFERGLTLREVARATGLANPQAADRRLRDILARLRHALERNPGVLREKPQAGSV